MLDKQSLRNCIKESLEKYTFRLEQELVGENEEFLDRSLRKFRTSIARVSWKSRQKWCKWNDSGPVLMPDYARVYYRQGKTEVILQEIPPQIRLMKFRGSLTLRENTGQSINKNESQKINHYSLALPYIVFIFKFVEGMFVEVKCAFSDRPLKKLTEKPLVPYLSNIDSNLSVCLGKSLDLSKLIKGELTQQIALILDNFWQTAYSDEWSGHFWANRAHFQETDERMKSVQSWAEQSQKNSLFVIEDVNWLKYSEESFAYIITKMFFDDVENQEMSQELYDQFTDLFFDEMQRTIKQNIESVTQKFYKETVDEIVQKLK